MSTREDTFINKDGNICMVRCIKCKRENYAMAVYSGMCAWCGHDANADKSLKPEEKKDEKKNNG